MPVDISAIAYALRQHFASTPLALGHGHAMELAAAALGYKTLAAYKASTEEEPTLNGAAHLVLDYAQLDLRAAELGITADSGEQLAGAVTNVFSSLLPETRQHLSESRLEDWLRDLVQETVLADGDANSAMAMTNGSLGEVYLPFEVSFGEIPAPGDELVIDIDGHIWMDQDLERPYSGHKVEVQAKLVLARVGRACFPKPQCWVESAQLDYSW